MAIGADGIMAEVHPDPAVALSDAAQQMDLKQFDHFFDECQISRERKFAHKAIKQTHVMWKAQ